MTDNDIEITRLMNDFIESSYPLGRIKEKNRFKKGICIDGQNFFLPKDKIAVIGTMYNILELVYAASPERIGQVISTQYNLKV